MDIQRTDNVCEPCYGYGPIACQASYADAVKGTVARASSEDSPADVESLGILVILLDRVRGTVSRVGSHHSVPF